MIEAASRTITEDCRCPRCLEARLQASATAWTCLACGQVYLCDRGVPRLYLEAALSKVDRDLRDRFYGGLVGAAYRRVMPFLTLPARPWSLSWPDWLVFAAVWSLLIAIVLRLGDLALVRHLQSFDAVDAAAVLAAVGAAIFFLAHAYLFHLFWLAIPVRIALSRRRFTPITSFQAVHRRVIEVLKAAPGPLRVLDVSTGACASLFRHGWMELDAEFTAVDLSPTMLFQGVEFMGRYKVPVRFALADAANLPFVSGGFDVVLNYGAINGMGDPARALAEMARVARPGGVVLFLDEQLHAGATGVERSYFKRVLASHDAIDHCPVELLPAGLADVEVHQVYQFYYICTARKV